MVSDWDIEIREASDKHELPYGLIRALIEHESSGVASAIRYEPGFKTQYLDGKSWPTFGPNISQATEVMQRATSWGLMQIMGQTAREAGCRNEFISDLVLRPALGIDMGCRHLKKLEARYFSQHGWAGVIAAYNAGSPRFDRSGAFVNAAYVYRVRKTWSA